MDSRTFPLQETNLRTVLAKTNSFHALRFTNKLKNFRFCFLWTKINCVSSSAVKKEVYTCNICQSVLLILLDVSFKCSKNG